MERLEECDCCGDIFPMTEVVYNGVQFLCPVCKRSYFGHELPTGKLTAEQAAQSIAKHFGSRILTLAY